MGATPFSDVACRANSRPAARDREEGTHIATQAGASFRILFDARMVHYRRAGIGQYAVNIVQAMSRLPEMGPQSKVGILQMRDDNDPIVPDDPRFRRIGMRTPPHNRFEQIALGAELLGVWTGMRPQLIHSPDFVPPRFRLMPAVVNVQDLAFLKLPDTILLTDESKRYYSQVPWAARNAEALIALSSSARDDIVDLLGVNPNKIAVIPAAAGNQFTQPASYRAAQETAAKRHDLPAPADGGYILFVGTIEPRKNLPVLLDAYSLLHSRRRVDPLPVLAIAGQEGWLFDEVYERIRELGLQGSVRLLGGVSDGLLVGLYQGARAFVLPSLYEGFGLPALEAMACGVPVIASSAGSLPEVVGDAGILLDPHDVDAWADTLERVLLDGREAQKLSEAGIKRAAGFSWEEAARRTWQLYRKVIER